MFILLLLYIIIIFIIIIINNQQTARTVPTCISATIKLPGIALLNL